MSSRIELVVTRPGHPERRLMLRPGILRLGRAEDNDLVLADVGVSRRHARIIVNEAGALIEDLGSGNGTIYRGQPVRQHQVQDGDQLQIEPFMLQFRLSPIRGPMQRAAVGAQLVVLAGEQLAPSYPIPPGGLTMGRATDQSIVLHDPGSSRRHAVISVRQGGFWLEDNGSANGVFVNGTRIWQHLLQDQDIVKIGHVEFRFELEGGSQADPFSRIWEESGVWQRPPSEDGAAPFAMPPPTPHRSEAPTEETATRPIPKSRRSMQSLSIIAGVLAALFIGGAAVVGWQVWLMMEEQGAGRPTPVLLPAEVPLSAEDALAVERRQIQGQALLAAGRGMEAVLYFYQSLKLAPEDPEVKRVVGVACEEAVLGQLVDELHRQQVSDADKRNTYRSVLRAARRPSPEALPQLRLDLEEALLLFPEDADLTEALGSIDAALAAVALEKLAEAEGLEGAAARAAAEAALAISPTLDAPADLIAADNLAAQQQARGMVEQAIRLELLGLSSEAAGLYASAAALLPGETKPLERLATARIDALAR